MFTSGTLSTFEQVYPTFRLFELDKKTLVPLKIHTYKLDIFAEDPKWELDHTLPEHFGLKDLRPSEVESIADRIIKGDQELAVKFESGKANGGPETKIESCNLP